MSIKPHLLYSQLPAIDRLLREPPIESLVVTNWQWVAALPIDRLPRYVLTFTLIDWRGAALEALAERWRCLPQPVSVSAAGDCGWIYAAWNKKAR